MSKLILSNNAKYGVKNIKVIKQLDAVEYKKLVAKVDEQNSPKQEDNTLTNNLVIRSDADGKVLLKKMN